jgi:hypothetical protein
MTVSLMANEQRTFDLACPTGKRVLGGGYETIADATVVALSSFAPTQTSWRVTVRLSQATAATFSFRVYAVCAFSN